MSPLINVSPRTTELDVVNKASVKTHVGRDLQPALFVPKSALYQSNLVFSDGCPWVKDASHGLRFDDSERVGDVLSSRYYLKIFDLVVLLVSVLVVDGKARWYRAKERLGNQAMHLLMVMDSLVAQANSAISLLINSVRKNVANSCGHRSANSHDSTLGRDSINRLKAAHRFPVFHSLDHILFEVRK